MVSDLGCKYCTTEMLPLNVMTEFASYLEKESVCNASNDSKDRFLTETEVYFSPTIDQDVIDH